MLHFLVLGALIYFLTPKPAGNRVEISSAVLDSIRPAQGAIAGATKEQAAAIGRARYVEDEVLVREAQRLGLAEDDPIIRARLVQRVLFLAEDLEGASREPSEKELERCFATAPDAYRVPERFELVHVFSRTRERSFGLTPELERWDVEHSKAPSELPPLLGDAFPLQRHIEAARKQIEDTYGAEFARAVSLQKLGEWSAPIGSRYGFHRVKLIAHQAERAATFREARGRLQLDCAIRRREQAVDHFMRQAFARYQIEIDGQPTNGWEPTRRSAPRSETSAEDL